MLPTGPTTVPTVRRQPYFVFLLTAFLCDRMSLHDIVCPFGYYWSSHGPLLQILRALQGHTMGGRL
jgi:hypothetical protein